MSEKKFEKFVTPIGVMQYPNVQVSRQFDGKGKFAYDTRVAYPRTAEIVKLTELIEERLVAHASANPGKKKADPPFFIDEKTGEVVLKFKVAATLVSKRTGRERDMRPVLFDAKDPERRPLPVTDPPTTTIGSGTKAQVSFSFYEWTTPKEAGVTLQPGAFLIHEIVAPTTGDAAGYGFTEEDLGEL